MWYWLYSLVLIRYIKTGVSKISTITLLGFSPNHFVLTALLLISAALTSMAQEQVPVDTTISEPTEMTPVHPDSMAISVPAGYLEELKIINPEEPAVSPDNVSTIAADTLQPESPDSLLAADTLQIPAVNESSSALKAPVVYDARDSVVYDVINKRVLLYGEAMVVYEEIKLEADYIEYGFSSNEVYAKGRIDTAGKEVGYPVFTEKSSSFDADTIRYNFITKKGLVNRVYTNEGENYVLSRVSKYHPNGQIHNFKGRFTTCNLPNPHYAFHFNRLIMIPDDKIVSGGAIMKFRKIPTPLALPFGFFPIENKEKAGVLIPTWGDADDLGFFLLNGGYYIPISKHVDTKFLGDIYTGGSWALRNFTNYKVRYRFTGDFNLDYNRQRRGDPEFPGFTRNTQFFVRWNHRQDPKARPDSRFSANVNLGSSNSFTNHLNSSQADFLTNTFQSNIQYSKSFSGKPYSLSVSARHNQNSRTKQYNFILPQLTFNLARVFLPLSFLRKSQTGSKKWFEKIGITYQGNFENRLTVNEEELAMDQFDRLRREFRNGIRHNVGASTSLKIWHFTFNPSFNYTDRWYFQTIQRNIDPLTLESRTDTLSGFWSANDWNLNGNLTTKLYGMYQFKGDRIRTIRHVITPTVGLSFRPGFPTQRYGFFGEGGSLASYSPFQNGIYGQPPATRSGRINFGLVNNLEMKGVAKRDTTDGELRKMKLIDNLSLNSSYDMFRDSLRWSNINISGRTTLFRKININVNTSFSPYSYDNLGRTINKSMYTDRGKLMRFTNGSVAIGGSIQSRNRSSDRQTTNTQSTDRGSEEELEFIEDNPEFFVDWNVPWTLNFNYTLNANRTFFLQQEELVDSMIVSQSIMVNGDITLFKNWKLGINSGYDFVNKEPTTTTITLYWDLHCWEFQASVVPFGIRKSYQVHINVKASILQDLKLQRRGNLGSNQNYF